MKTFYTFIIFLFSVLVCFSQTPKISGSVCLDTCPDNRMAGSLVKVAYKDKEGKEEKNKSKEGLAAEVQANGEFELGLLSKPKFPIGVTIQPNAIYRNYVVINEFDVANVIVGIPINIKMCKKEEVDALRATYYKVNIDRLQKEEKEKIQKLENEINTLKKQNKEFQSKVKELEDLKLKYEELKKYADETVKKISIAEIENRMLKNNPNYLANIRQEGYNNQINIQEESAKKGDVETVTKNYTPLGLADALDKDIISGMNKYLSDIGYQKLFGQFDLAVEYYPEVIKLSKKFENNDNFTFLYNYEAAELCYLINDFKKANSFISATLELKDFVNQKYLVKAYNLSGKIKDALNENKYHNEYQKAINVFKQLKKETFDDSETSKEAAISYILLGNYCKERGKNETAKTNYHKALDIYTELNKVCEYEVEAQCVILLNLVEIYDKENKASMVKKCSDRITLLKEIDKTVEQNSTIYNLELAKYNMQNKNFSEANYFYLKVIGKLKENPNLNQRELIKILLFMGLNQFYAKSYNEALNYFSQAEHFLSQDSTLQGKDFVRFKALCMAAKGIIIKEQNNKENGLLLYNQARNIVENDKTLTADDKKLLLKDMAHLKNYHHLETRDIIIKSIGGVSSIAVYIILLLSV